MPAFGHHAFVDFDRGRTIEVAGEVTNVVWRNPHIRLTIVSDGEAWDIEGSSLSILGRTGITEEDFRVGQSVRLAGWPVHSGANRLHVNNALIDGQEYVLSSRGQPRWEDTAIGTSHELFASGRESADNSLFRVWTTDGDDPHSNTPGFWPGEYPMTDWALEQRAQWTPLTGAECEPKGMPTIMEQPYPIGFVDEDERILLRIEEYDTVRTIHMNGGNPETTEATLLGHSRGRWEGSTLVVETDRIDWAYFDK